MYYVETKRLILRPFSLCDAKEYFKIISDKDIVKYVPYSSALKLETTYEHLETYVEGDFRRDFYVCICLKETNQIIGAIIAVSLSEVLLDVSYFIGAEFRNKGYCTEAMMAFMRSIYDISPEMGWRLNFTIEDDNAPSIRVAEKCNAKKYGEQAKACIYRIKMENIAELL